MEDSARLSQIFDDSLPVLVVVFYCSQETSHSHSEIPGARSGFLGQLQTKQPFTWTRSVFLVFHFYLGVGD